MSWQRPQLEVADLVRSYGGELCRRSRLSAIQYKVISRIASCRTAALGGHVDRCDGCGHERISYNSCRDRHCPKCQGSQRAKWVAQRIERLLPVPYFHVVFTVPSELGSLIYHNQRLMYGIFFAAVAGTIKQIAADPKHLGAEVALTCVLHTWAQNLTFHPHLHCVVTGGGLASDGRSWVTGGDKYFLPVRVLARLFRGKFLAAAGQAYQDGTLKTGDTDWFALKDRLYRTDWVVYAKAPFGGPEQVFKYLGRYTHRVAISNHRLLELRADQVTIAVRDNATGKMTSTLTLCAVEFLRRFLLHALPAGFVRIRHYGLTAGRNVHTKLAVAQRLLKRRHIRCQRTARLDDLQHTDYSVCPACGEKRLVLDRILPKSPGRCVMNLIRGSPITGSEAA